MHVKKRDGTLEAVSFDKVITRISKQCNDLLSIDPINIAQKVCSRIYDGVKTSELDELAAQICSSLITEHPEYGILASRIIISNHQKNTSPSFSETIQLLYNAFDNRIQSKNPLISDEIYDIVMNNKEKLNNVMKYDRDYLIDYFGFKTLERSYLLKINDKVIERPQHLFMRVSLGIHSNDIKEAIETYDYMSQKYFIHATPTLFNSGTPRPQMASCFLQAAIDDSIDGIFETLKNCANISKYSGGIGLHIHNIRGNGSYIRGTNGTSNGIIPMLTVFNKAALYVDQCFRGDTHVYTNTGAIKIERIKPDMKVLTFDGSYRRVLKVIKNQINKPTLRIRTNNSIDTIYVTKEHQIYAIKDAPSIPINEIPNHIKNTKKPKPAYVDAKRLNTFDFIGYPIPQFQDCDVYEDDISQLSGMIYTNGTYIGDFYTVSFYRDKGDKAKIFIRELLKEQNIEYTEGTQKNYNFIKWKADKNKIDLVDNKDIFNLNKENTISFIKGCLIANGCSINLDYKCMFFNTQIKAVGYTLRYLFMKIGMLVDGFYKGNHNHYVICIPYTQILFDMFEFKDKAADETTLSYFEYDNILWTGIKSIDEMKEFNGIVYDLNIEDNHNYTTEMGIVHNSGKRNGNFAIYLEPSHPDIRAFIDLRKNHGNENERCRELFTALWIPDLFMKRVQNNEKWSLFCPDKCPLLSNVYGDEYEKIYTEYEEKEMYVKQLNAVELWKEICIAQKETGTPYIVFKDSSNIKSNQKNVGTIKSSNLCVTGDTKILTSTGYSIISDLVDKTIDVWNGSEFTQTIVKKTGDNQDIVKIVLSNGAEISCTPYHKFYDEFYNEIIAKDLTKGTSLLTCKYPLIDDDNKETRLRWFQNIVEQDADIYDDNIILEVKDKDYLNELRYNVHMLGCDPIINKIGDFWSFQITFKDICSLFKIGFTLKRDMTFTSSNIDVNTIYVEDIIPLDEKADTYCFTESKKGMGVFNGILTGQCSEILLYSDKHETAVCNLASIALPMFINKSEFDFNQLHKISKIVCKNINKVIDRTFYPTPETERSNKRHRPLGIGVQGLADVYAILEYPFDSDEARELNKKIFETIYHGALEMSIELSQKYGPYESYEGSPISQGLLQFDLWNVQPSDLWKWDELKQLIKQFGVRNSMLTSLMPTASTSQILGFNECFEPFTNNIYNRRTLAGEFFVINKYLINKLISLGLWNKDMKNKIIENSGSIQTIDEIPIEIKNIFKTAFELHPKAIINQAIERGPYICQSQSMNLFLEEPDLKLITNIHFYSWKNGLKTGMYYMRTRPKAKVMAFSMQPKTIYNAENDICQSCSA